MSVCGFVSVWGVLGVCVALGVGVFGGGGGGGGGGCTSGNE